MPDIKFTQSEKETMVAKLQSYFEKELDQEIGQFDAEFLLDFFSKDIGAYYYNRGLHDARAILEARVEVIGDEIFAFEQEIN